MPQANKLTVGIMALVAEQEREFISQRTKAALQAAKARGQKLGNPTGKPPKATAASRARGGATTAANAQAFAERLRPVFAALAPLGARACARELQRRGIATPRGGQWSAGLVQATRRRLKG